MQQVASAVRYTLNFTFMLNWSASFFFFNFTSVAVPGGFVNKVFDIVGDFLGKTLVEHNRRDGSFSARVTELPPLRSHGCIHDYFAFVLSQGYLPCLLQYAEINIAVIAERCHCHCLPWHTGVQIQSVLLSGSLHLNPSPFVSRNRESKKLNLNHLR